MRLDLNGKNFFYHKLVWFTGKRRKSPERSKTPPKTREVSPPRQPVKDDFFDARSSGPTFTFRRYNEEDKTVQEEFLSGYKVCKIAPQLLLCSLIH